MIQWVRDTLPRGCRELTSRQSKLHTVVGQECNTGGRDFFNHTINKIQHRKNYDNL